VPAPALAAVDVAGAPQAWEQLGFAIDGAEIRIGATTLRIGAADAGIAGWTLAGQGEGDVDGLLTRWIAAAGPPDTPPAHPNGALLVDHVVVATPDLERTLAALADVGPLHQAFFRMGEVILEVVGPPQPAGDEPARFWGLVVVVADLDACAVRLGADLGAPRDAVQPGRRIATVRSTSGVSVPLALMTPDPRHRSRSPPPTAG
jgi:hypothetical protein